MKSNERRDDEARKILLKMLHLSLESFQQSSRAFLDREEVDIEQMCQRTLQVERLGSDVRRRMVISINLRGGNSNARKLMLLDAARDIEQLAESAGSILRLAGLGDRKKENDFYAKRARIMANSIERIFARVQDFLKNGLIPDDFQIQKGHTGVLESCDDILSELLHDQVISPQRAIAMALLARSMKRMSGHLKNIACPAV
jgi:phosphate uptake regulator